MKTQAAEPAVNVESIKLVPQIKIAGAVGTVFTVEYATDLAQPDSWRRLEDLVLLESPFYYLDLTTTEGGRRFYRVTSGPRHPALVWLEPGNFTMGSPSTEADRFDDEGPLTLVTLTKGFWLGAKEVSQLEYSSLIGSNPSSFDGDLSRPVENVSWDEAVEYCAKLTLQESKAGILPEGFAYRLPTEAEWEYAARAGTATSFSYGDDPLYARLNEFCWFGENSGGTTHSGGVKAANPWGLYDLYGNVWEWCQDSYVVSHLGGSVKDPQGPLLTATKVIRGGSWKGLSRFCRSASRGSSLSHIRGNNVGFRVVLAATRN